MTVDASREAGSCGSAAVICDNRDEVSSTGPVVTAVYPWMYEMNKVDCTYSGGVYSYPPGETLYASLTNKPMCGNTMQAADLA